MRIVVVGPGRAAMSLATAFNNAGHQIVGLLGRGDPTPQIEALGADWLAWDAPLPSADLLLLGVRDDAIAEV
ncbi:MAG: NADP oxidoreductase, partial [Acidimicrobiia bacterium]